MATFAPSREKTMAPPEMAAAVKPSQRYHFHSSLFVGTRWDLDHSRRSIGQDPNHLLVGIYLV
jgi:hypothetical protein